MSERSILLGAIARSDPAERAAYLREACAGDAELRRRVEELLAVHERPGAFMDAPAGPGERTDPVDEEADATDAGLALSAIAEGTGSWIGPYHLLQQIGEGGMGLVYMAEQEKPVRRRVALKIIKPGMDSRQVVARFEVERQALALMDHPNIARVLDAGSTDTGRPYFVMDLVKGIPITQYCDEARLSPRERLELFVPVCAAIQHAHQKGIIHRDVKPSNVLVTLIDAKPVPKVIDFGVAKAIEQRLTEKTLFTQFGALVGTPEYMSPEQAEISGLDVDTRSDIYSLGILLYELLTGSTPLEREKLRAAGYAEILRRIKEEEAPRPSTRLSHSGDRLASIAATRATEPARLTRLVKGELDWIVMKAIEKTRGRRYETASAFALDVQRYLAGDAVEASPPSTTYRLKAFLRRHRVAFLAGSAFVLLLVLGTLISAWQAIKAVRAESAMATQRDRALAAEAEARAVSDFLLNDLLAQASPVGQSYSQLAIDRDMKVRTLLDRAAKRLGDKFKDRPAVEASIRRTIGRAYYQLGEYDKGREFLEEARRLFVELEGESSPDALEVTSSLAMAVILQGKYSEGFAMLRKSVESARKSLGEGHATSARLLIALGGAHSYVGNTAEVSACLREALSILRRVGGDEDRRTWHAMASLGGALAAEGKLDEAEQLLSEARDRFREAGGDRDLATSNTTHMLGTVYVRQSRFSEAETCMKGALEQRRSALGEDDYGTLMQERDLASLYETQRRFDLAEDWYRKTLEGFRKLPGEMKPAMQSALWTLAGMYQKAGKVDQARECYDKALELAGGLEKDHPFRGFAVSNLAWFLATAAESRARNPTRAIELARQAITLAPEEGSSWNTLGAAQYRAGDWKAAVASLQRSMELQKGGGSYDWFFLAMARWQLGDKDEARDWYRKSVDGMTGTNAKNEDLLRFRDEAAALLGIKP
jgi:non-specific serine/threonine protein kinase/serine/threonine-protein kinase